MTSEGLVTTDVERAARGDPGRRTRRDADRDRVRARGRRHEPRRSGSDLRRQGTAGRPPADRAPLVGRSNSTSGRRRCRRRRRSLIDAAWPGPLTVIVPRAAGVLDAVTGGLDTVGLRVPAHHVARGVCSAWCPWGWPHRRRTGSAPSARPPPSTCCSDLGDRLDPHRDVILDGGRVPDRRREHDRRLCEHAPADPPSRGHPGRGHPPAARRRRRTTRRAPAEPAACWRRTMRPDARYAWSTPPTMPLHCAPAPSVPRSSTSPTTWSCTPASCMPGSATPTIAASRP